MKQTHAESPLWVVPQWGFLAIRTFIHNALQLQYPLERCGYAQDITGWHARMIQSVWACDSVAMFVTELNQDKLKRSKKGKEIALGNSWQLKQQKAGFESISCVCMHVFYTYIYIYVFLCMHTHIYIYTHVCVYNYIYIIIYIYCWAGDSWGLTHTPEFAKWFPSSRESECHLNAGQKYVGCRYCVNIQMYLVARNLQQSSPPNERRPCSIHTVRGKWR